MTKNTCYFILHRVSNIDLRNAENSISGPLDFKIFWGDMPPNPPRGSRLRRSYLITPLINIPVNTNTLPKTSATRLENRVLGLRGVLSRPHKVHLFQELELLRISVFVACVTLESGLTGFFFDSWQACK